MMKALESARSTRRSPLSGSTALFGHNDLSQGALESARQVADMVKAQTTIGPGLDASSIKKRGTIAAQINEVWRTEFRRYDFDEYGMRRPTVNPDFLFAPLDAATDADSLGTLAGTFISQRYIDLFHYNLPLLDRVANDFSEESGQLNQVSNTRKIVVPSVVSYDPTLDTDGYPKGWTPVTPMQTIDVNITMDELIGVPIQYDLAAMSSTARKLFEEQIPAAAYAAALYFYKKIFAVCTAANFNAYANVTAADANGIVKVPIAYPTFPCSLVDFARSRISDIGSAFDSNEVPDNNRTLLLNAPFYNKATCDPSVTTFFAGQQAPEIVTQGVLPNLAGFVPIKAPSFPGTNQRFGIALQKNGLITKSRLPANLNSSGPNGLGGNGSVTQIVHETGLAMLVSSFVDHKRGYTCALPSAILGAAKGDTRGGIVCTTQ